MRFGKPSRPRKGPLPFRYVLLLSFLIFVVLTVQGLWIIEKGVRPTLVHIATSEAKKIAREAINDAVSKKIADSLDVNDILLMERDSEGQVTTIQFNTQVYNRVLSETTGRAQRYLRAVEQGRAYDMTIADHIDLDHTDQNEFTQDGQGSIIYTIPLGQATNNALLAHLGPQVPVRFSAIGDVQSTLSYDIERAGINSSWLFLNVDMEVDVKIVIPFATKTEAVKTTFPVGNVYVQGKVPDVFSDGGGVIIPSDTPTSGGGN
ncbi:sporulation protein YunB [Bacillus sp. FJAT-45037]|uniref:sporulation protein YunB n=1 Tax=Bacillus sp. FJAT-45037 TaxID=2011007 RepID=UPI000C2447A6|nr:sporulation protein YunB [Bacillus sp. FJAT-45037]